MKRRVKAKIVFFFNLKYGVVPESTHDLRTVKGGGERVPGLCLCKHIK